VITFKSTEDLAKLSPDDPAFPTVKDLVERLIADYTWEGHPYNPDWYGYTILIQEGDADRTLDEIWDGCSLLTIPWEGIMKLGDFFIAIYLANVEGSRRMRFKTHPHQLISISPYYSAGIARTTCTAFLEITFLVAVGIFIGMNDDTAAVSIKQAETAR